MGSFALRYMRQFSYGAVFVLLASAGLGVPAPQDITLLLAGYLIQRGMMTSAITVPICVLGAVTGDILGFWLVRKGAGQLRRLPRLGAILTSERFARARSALVRHEGLTIALGRNVAGVRTAIFATAAATGTPLGRFLLWDFLASIPNVALLLSLGYGFSNNLKAIIKSVSQAEHWIAIGCVVLAIAWLVMSRRSRRGPEAGTD